MAEDGVGCTVRVRAVLGLDVAVVICPVFLEFGDRDRVAAIVGAISVKGPGGEGVVGVAGYVGIEMSGLAGNAGLLLDVVEDICLALFALNRQGAVDGVGCGWRCLGRVDPVEDVVGQGGIVGIRDRFLYGRKSGEKIGDGLDGVGAGFSVDGHYQTSFGIGSFHIIPFQDLL